jgi:D-alanyl-D-alanine carboxypeptidase
MGPRGLCSKRTTELRSHSPIGLMTEALYVLRARNNSPRHHPAKNDQTLRRSAALAEILAKSVKKTFIVLAFAIAAIAGAYGGYRYWALSQENSTLNQLGASQADQIAMLEDTVSSTNNDVANLQIALSSTTQSLQNEQAINASFESQITQLSGTVGQLQKVANTDPQLLEKYSKVYFLNENYVPASLSPVDAHYLFNTSRPELALSGVLPDLEALLAAAERAGVTLRIVSAYRSFYEQATLKLDYVITYGAGTANQFSASQGYSEHQLGTAVDFGTPNGKNLVPQFASSSAYKWLADNAYQYGFVISYPSGNIYYQYEPWHWRFVGRKARNLSPRP